VVAAGGQSHGRACRREIFFRALLPVGGGFDLISYTLSTRPAVRVGVSHFGQADFETYRIFCTG
jgi:hypothetical protein